MTVTFVEVVVHQPQVQGVFHYHVPEDLREAVQPGVIVEVPFGSRYVYGVVLRFIEQPDVPETKPVLAVPDASVRLTALQLQLAQRMAHDTLASLAACVALMAPPGVLQTADSRYALTPQAPAPDALPADLSDTERRVLTLLAERGALRGRQLARALPRRNWRNAVTRLHRRGWLARTPVLPRPKVSRQYEAMVRLAVSPADARHWPAARLATRPHVQARRRQVLEALASGGPQPERLLAAVVEAKPADFQALEKLGLIQRYREPRYRDPLADFVAPAPETPPALTPAQARAWDIIRPRLQEAAQGQPPTPILLHGVTGSGKTEIYLRATAEALALGRQVVVLVPEIALTPQTIRRFRARFGPVVGVLHSGLSLGERYDTWLRVRRGDIRVLIGPRSALFAPFSNLGLIVVDECHEEAYFNERLPFYHARDVALAYGEMASAAVILGTATPDVVTYARAQAGKITLLELPRRVLAHRRLVAAQVEKTGRMADQTFAPAGGDAWAASLPPVQVVDMRAELRAGQRGIFSRPLLQALGEVLQRGEQAILFLNRRGSATYVFCRDCGHVMRCPRCDLPLTYHQGEGALLCHHCGYRRKMPARCPACGGERLRPYGAGTERVEAEVLRHFPHARTLRWDADTTSAKGGHEAILGHFVSRQADVLIGTQMLAKGLDLPFVTLVGIVLADVGLTLPDYRAAERGFQLLVQVAGRAGRSPLGGRVVLQTYMPEHYAIRAAAGHDFAGFYQQELAVRRKLGYPPYARLVRLRLRDWRAERVRREAEAMKAKVQTWLREGGHVATQIIGPAPCFYAREGGRYCWHLILRGPRPEDILRGRALGEWEVIVNPPTLL